MLAYQYQFASLSKVVQNDYLYMGMQNVFRTKLEKGQINIFLEFRGASQFHEIDENLVANVTMNSYGHNNLEGVKPFSGVEKCLPPPPPPPPPKGLKIPGYGKLPFCL